MTGKLTILTFVLTISIAGYCQIKTHNKIQMKQEDINSIDTSIIAVLPFDSAQHWIFKGNKQTDLTADDIQNIEAILAKCINNYNIEQEKQFEEINKKNPEYKLEKKDFIIDLKRYKRQYVATINSKGEKEVWVNCFCNTHNLNWRTESIIVKDGGNCYFNVKINLTSGQFYEFMVNGEA